MSDDSTATDMLIADIGRICKDIDGYKRSLEGHEEEEQYHRRAASGDRNKLNELNKQLDIKINELREGN